MNADEINWLLQTTEHAKTSKRFVQARTRAPEFLMKGRRPVTPEHFDTTLDTNARGIYFTAHSLSRFAAGARRVPWLQARVVRKGSRRGRQTYAGERKAIPRDDRDQGRANDLRVLAVWPRLPSSRRPKSEGRSRGARGGVWGACWNMPRIAMGFVSVKPSWLYSRFPGGSVGLALLVLRLVDGLELVGEAFRLLVPAGAASEPTRVLLSENTAIDERRLHHSQRLVQLAQGVSLA